MKNGTTQVFVILIPIILAVFLSYWGLTNNMNQRLDKIWEKTNGLNREIGEVDVKTSNLSREIVEANAKIESNFVNVQSRLNEIEKLISSL